MYFWVLLQTLTLLSTDIGSWCLIALVQCVEVMALRVFAGGLVSSSTPWGTLKSRFWKPLGTGGGFASGRSAQDPSWCRMGCHCAPHPPPRSANRIRRQRAPSPQNPRLFLACSVWSGVLRVPLSCFHKPEISGLWDSIWSTSYQYIWRWLLDVMAPQHGLAFIMT